MKKTNRTNVFETNSSNTHALSIDTSKCTALDIPKLNSKGELDILVDENTFPSNDYDDYYSIESKLALVAFFVNRSDYKFVINGKFITIADNANLHDFHRERYKKTFEKVVKTVIKCKKINYEITFGYFGNDTYYYKEDWNDDRSKFILEPSDVQAILEDEAKLFSFLFNENSYIKADYD